MRHYLRLLPLCISMLMLPLGASAEEKNGIQVNVQKVTLDRADMRGADVNMESLDRLMGLRVALKNTGFKPVPESEVTWEILRRHYDSGALELTSGVEKLQRLRAGESVELTMGMAKVAGVRNGAVLRKDELEWELTITQDGKEVAKFASKSNFPMLLKRSVRVELPAAPAAPSAPAATPAPPPPPAGAPAATPAPPKP
ncbi:MAG TPA: hypothetical protein VK961_19975 [Chthoniobacter sp.]|nr:hypothetical protein [Chthoniobacter sp.]